ncbi:MAG TPA: hypothetical protein VKT80_02735 [Chloroflexota bacterium]|nr:hypothetical protein [Chloroflexota bacterium]
MGKRTAKAKELLGYVTADRDVEARGRLEEQIADPSNPASEETEDEIREEQLRLRRERGEYQPEWLPGSSGNDG